MICITIISSIMSNFFLIIKYGNFPWHFVRGMFENLACLLTRWHANLKNRHAVWYVDTFISTLARKNEKLARFWHVGMQARWHVNHVGT